MTERDTWRGRLLGGGSESRTLRLLAGIVLLAFVLRLAWVVAVPSVPGGPDTVFYDTTAWNIATGHGFGDRIRDDGISYYPTARHPPGYSYFVAGLYEVFGHEVFVVRIAQVLIGTLTVLLAYVAARRLVPAHVALIAASFVALMPSLIIWSSPMMSDSLCMFVFTAAVGALLWSRVGSAIDLRLVLVAGVLIGLAALVRPESLLLTPAAFVWLARPGRATPGLMPASGLLVAIPLLALAPWTVRNAVEMDGFILVSSSGGLNFLRGHVPEANGTFVPLPESVANPDPHLPTDPVEREVASQRYGYREGLEYILKNPLREPGLALRKVIWLWKPSSDAVDSAESAGKTSLGAANLPLKAFVIAAGIGFGLLVIAGLFQGRGTEMAVLPATLLVLWTGFYILYFALSRYQLPLLPLLAIPAAVGLLALLPKLSALVNRTRGA